MTKPTWVLTLTLLILEFTKDKHTLRIYQEEMFLLLGLDYCPVLSSTITVKLQKQIGNNTAFLSVQEL